MLVPATALLLGFLHGLGADHLMAIAALSVGGAGRGAGLRAGAPVGVALRFAIGHALMMGGGAGAAVVLGWSVPAIAERAGEVTGGLILVALGAMGLWAGSTRRVYVHRHPHGSPPHAHWHVHLGRGHWHRDSRLHAHVPTLVGAAFAVSGLRALTLLLPVAGQPPLLTLLALVAVFALGIMLAMSLFGIVLARVARTAVASAWAARAAALVTSAASVALGAYWLAA